MADDRALEVKILELQWFRYNSRPPIRHVDKVNQFENRMLKLSNETVEKPSSSTLSKETIINAFLQSIESCWSNIFSIE